MPARKIGLLALVCVCVGCEGKTPPTPNATEAATAAVTAAVTAAECERLVDHVRELMAREQIQPDGAAARAEMVERCVSSLDRAQLECTLAAQRRADLIRCRGAGKPERPEAPDERECRRAAAHLAELTGLPPRGDPEAALAECRQELSRAQVGCILAAKTQDDLARCEAAGAKGRLDVEPPNAR
jgi:LipL41-expression chaperone Lep